METENVVKTPLFYIEYYNVKTGKLQDISEESYATLELCMTQIESENKEDEEIRHELLADYEEKLKNFVLDLDTSDCEPVNPLRAVWRYDKKPALYITDENGFHKATEHAIKDLNLLQATPELIKTVNSILDGTLDPETFKSVQDWISVSYNKPNTEEMKMCAINQVLEAYGVESILTSKWENGYWCDILCTYVSMGDSYIPTVIHHRKHGFMVAGIGDIIEKNKHVI